MASKINSLNSATERIGRRVQTLDFMKSHLVELHKMALAQHVDMLTYLIEMAVIEADTLIDQSKIKITQALNDRPIGAQKS